MKHPANPKSEDLARARKLVKEAKNTDALVLLMAGAFFVDRQKLEAAQQEHRRLESEVDAMQARALSAENELAKLKAKNPDAIAYGLKMAAKKQKEIMRNEIREHLKRQVNAAAVVVELAALVKAFAPRFSFAGFSIFKNNDLAQFKAKAQTVSEFKTVDKCE